MQPTYQRDAPQPPCCSSVLFLCCCSGAQVQLVGLCNHLVRLHSCTLPVLLLKLLLWLGFGWRVQTFFVSLSWVSIAWVPWLGYLEQVSIRKTQQNCPNSPLVHIFPPLIEEKVEESSRSYQNYLINLIKFTRVQVSKCSLRSWTIILEIIVNP